jgi:hypothetical protein
MIHDDLTSDNIHLSRTKIPQNAALAEAQIPPKHPSMSMLHLSFVIASPMTSAHNRVMSVAAVQQYLHVSGGVAAIENGALPFPAVREPQSGDDWR